MRIFSLFFLLLLTSTTYCQTNDEMIKEVKPVIDAICKASGIKNQIKLEIAKDNGYIAVAKYATNKIMIDPLLYKLAQNFGEKKNDFLAIVLGHEIYHLRAAQPQPVRGFVNRFCESKQKEEENADLFGTFSAYLAQYDISLVDPVIYELFEGKDKYMLSDSCNAKLQERKQSNDKVKVMLDSLVSIYEIGNTMMAAGKYQIAAACYEHILTYYAGQEIYNNLGYCYLMQEMELQNYPFRLPIRSNWQSRLEQNTPINKAGGIVEYDFPLAKKAIEYLNIANDATRFDCNGSVQLNLMSVFAFLMRYQKKDSLKNQLETLINSKCLTGETFDAEVALICLLADPAVTSKNLQDALGKGKIVTDVSKLYEYNIEVLEKNGTTKSKSIEERCLNINKNLDTKPKPSNTVELAFGFYDSNQEPINIKVSKDKDSKQLSSFSVSGQQWICYSSPDITISVQNQLDLIETAEGWLYCCEEKKHIFLMDKNKKIQKVYIRK